jgi:hypothetical protein
LHSLCLLVSGISKASVHGLKRQPSHWHYLSSSINQMPMKEPAMENVKSAPAEKAPNTAAFNQWVQSALANPERARRLKSNWRKLVMEELPVSEAQKQHLYSIPEKDAHELQEAIATVVEHGGTIHLERASETSPGTLVVQPSKDALGSNGAAQAKFTVIIFHCTFDANCRNWHCGWGPR